MRFILGIKPYKIEGHGTTHDARTRVRESMRNWAWVSSSQFGTGFVDNFGRYIENVYAYNIEVYKRGKHRHNKHYVIYRYTFPIEMFKLLNVELRQGTRTFKITPKKK